MRNPIVNVEFSNLLDESIQYLNDVGEGEMQEKIDNGDTLQLQQMSSYDVDIAYENKSLNVALCVLGYLRTINQYVSYVLLVVTVVKIPIFAPINLFSFTTLGFSVFAFYFVSELCNHLELYICKYIYNKASLNRIIKFYNRDVEHINRCFTYMSEHSDNREIIGILSLYTSRFVDLFKYPNLIHLHGFAGIIEQQVEEAFVADSNGGMANIQSDLSTWSIFPDDGSNRASLLLPSLHKADYFMKKVNSYCLDSRTAGNPLHTRIQASWLVYDASVILIIWLFNSNLVLVLGCLFYLIKQMVVTNEEGVNAHKSALACDNMALENLDRDLIGGSAEDLKHVGPSYSRYLSRDGGHAYYRCLNYARDALYRCTEAKKFDGNNPVYVRLDM